MTVITPTQRQFIFTSSISERFDAKPQSLFFQVRAGLRHGFRHPRDLVVMLLPVVVIVNALWLLGGGINSVLLSFQIKRLSATLAAEQRVHDSLEADRSQLLSPDALQQYASMIQLGNPTHTRYITDTNEPVALNAGGHRVP